LSEKIINVNQDSFQKAVLDSQKPVLVDFWAPWCGPCRAVAPIIEELTNDYEGKIEFTRLNVDEAPFVASKYGIMSIPTLMVFKDGKPVQQAIGYQPKDQLKKLLDSTLTQ
jgi:thioredoxin 1